MRHLSDSRRAVREALSSPYLVGLINNSWKDEARDRPRTNNLELFPFPYGQEAWPDAARNRGGSSYDEQLELLARNRRETCCCEEDQKVHGKSNDTSYKI